MGMFKYTTLRVTARFEVPFSRPILDWTGVPGRFNAMVYDALAGRIVVNAGELAVHGSAVLGEVHAKYSIYGGASSIALYADRIVFDFPTLLPADFPIAGQVMTSIHDHFSDVFPELRYNTLNANSYEHVDLAETSAVDALLNNFRIPEAERSFSSGVVIHPAAKFRVVSQDQKWECAFSVERSALSATAAFTALTVMLTDVDPELPFVEKFKILRTAANACFAVVGLESVNVSQT